MPAASGTSVGLEAGEGGAGFGNPGQDCGNPQIEQIAAGRFQALDKSVAKEPPLTLMAEFMDGAETSVGWLQIPRAGRIFATQEGYSTRAKFSVRCPRAGQFHFAAGAASKSLSCIHSTSRCGQERIDSYLERVPMVNPCPPRA